ncbi:alpha-amylase family glycosyl hydrolase [Bacteroidota bacterium]
MKHIASLMTVVITGIIISSCNSIGNNPGRTDTNTYNWNNSTVYFLLTDRFNNGSPANDMNFDRMMETSPDRGFQGGDLKGITQKIREGYFDDLGITAIWMTPFFEQIHGIVDEGTGKTYGYHGYWAKDWTALDPNFGTEEDLAELVSTAHEHGIRIVMDVVINHTGPVTEIDPVWPGEWVRTTPACTYKDYRSTIRCTLVENLPDIRTENEADVPLPQALLEKWEAEGRLEQELAELDAFFERTGYPRAPKYYIIKWLTDYVRKHGINAYRLDTAKHTEETVWSILRTEADIAYADWKKENPETFVINEPFYMVGEVYNYGISGGRKFNFGDTLVDFYAEGIDHLINFEFKWDAHNSYEAIFSKYSDLLNYELQGKGVMNYISSHDDGDPFDKMREKPMEAATKLLLCPGAAQIYYGDETMRRLETPGTVGDANLRSFMNWDQLADNTEINGFKVSDVLEHYQKLGKFRKEHPAVGAGLHLMISDKPYIFSRSYEDEEIQDHVIVGLDLDNQPIRIPTKDIFEDGTELSDYYSGKTLTPENGVIEIIPYNGIVLLAKK